MITAKQWSGWTTKKGQTHNPKFTPQQKRGIFEHAGIDARFWEVHWDMLPDAIRKQIIDSVSVTIPSYPVEFTFQDDLWEVEETFKPDPLKEF